MYSVNFKRSWFIEQNLNLLLDECLIKNPEKFLIEWRNHLHYVELWHILSRTKLIWKCRFISRLLLNSVYQLLHCVGFTSLNGIEMFGKSIYVVFIWCRSTIHPELHSGIYGPSAQPAPISAQSMRGMRSRSIPKMWEKCRGTVLRSHWSFPMPCWE